MFRRLGLLILMVAAFGVAAPAVTGSNTAEAGKASSKKKASKKKAKKNPNAGKTKVCSTKKGKRRCKWIKEFQGHGIAKATLRTEPLPKPSGDIWLYMVNFDEELRVNLYDEHGELDDAALAQLDHAFRCRRSGEARAVDPKLYEMLSIISDRFQNQRIELVSGFRYEERDSSRHFHASAMDIRVPEAGNQEVYDFAQSLDAGGMGIGIYPHSGFVHVDIRAPGEPSYRWTDYSGSEGGGKKAKKSKKPKSRTAPARKPTS
jgi:uncharacterized protein YcbK (DUF882 family)